MGEAIGFSEIDQQGRMRLRTGQGLWHDQNAFILQNLPEDGSRNFRLFWLWSWLRTIQQQPPMNQRCTPGALAMPYWRDGLEISAH
jgi:hypothetical protein